MLLTFTTVTLKNTLFYH